MRALLAGDWWVTAGVLKIARRIWEVHGRRWLAGDWPSTGSVLNIIAAAWTAGFQWWRSGDITRTQNVSEYMLILALCLVLAILRSRCGIYIFALWFLSIFFFPRLISAAADWMSAILPHMVWP